MPANKPYHLNKCSLCSFASHVGSTFQRHLMKTHGMKLKDLEKGKTGNYSTLGRVINDYALEVKFQPKQIFNYACNHCPRKFPTVEKKKFHQTRCNKIRKAIKKNQMIYTCKRCDTKFLKPSCLRKHYLRCGQIKNVYCQLCPFKTYGSNKIERHLVDKHNLIARKVKEADFEQAMFHTPYILERPLQFETLPTLKDKDIFENFESIRNKHGSPKKRKLFQCEQCKTEFSKLKFLNRHTRKDKCWP